MLVTHGVTDWKFAVPEGSDITGADTFGLSGSACRAAPTLKRPHQEFMLDEIEKIMLAGAAAEEGLFTIDMDAVESAHQILVDYDVLGGLIDLAAAFDSQYVDTIPSDERLPE